MYQTKLSSLGSSMKYLGKNFPLFSLSSLSKKPQMQFRQATESLSQLEYYTAPRLSPEPPSWLQRALSSRGRASPRPGAAAIIAPVFMSALGLEHQRRPAPGPIGTELQVGERRKETAPRRLPRALRTGAHAAAAPPDSSQDSRSWHSLCFLLCLRTQRSLHALHRLFPMMF